MRYIIIMLLVFITISNSFSQKIENDTLVTYSESVISPWGMQFEVGGLYQQLLNQDYINSDIGADIGISLFYKGFFGKIEVAVSDFKPNKNMHFGNQLFDKTAEFSSVNLNMDLGYSYNLHKNWSACFQAGVNIANVDLNNSEEVDAFYTSDMLLGAIFGIGLTRYIRFRSNRFLTISAGVDYYTTKYSSLSPELRNSSINYSVMVGYKFLYRRLIR